MAKYIDKTTVKAEIKRLAEVGRNNASGFDKYRKEKAVWLQQADVCDRILSFLDTLEVKEVGEPSKDLEKEFDKYCENHIFDDECDVYTARKFFELGFKVQKGE